MRTPYVAPLADMRFVPRELIDIDSLAKLPDSESLADGELTDAILEQAARFASEVLAPLDSIECLARRSSSVSAITI